jgi:recombinational DNA repair ATPase RecF
MKILRIQAQDLFSYETLDLPLDDVGLVSIEGINHDDGGSNGSGKTSIYKVLTWTIYGDPLSKVLSDEVIRIAQEDAAAIRTAMLGMANALAPQLVGQSSPEAVRAIIDDWARATLQGWHDSLQGQAGKLTTGENE